MSYKPKHSKEEYYDLIIYANVKGFENDKGVYKTFSVASQHVKGESPEDCLDQIWDAVEEKKKRIAYYKTLPTLEEFVKSDKPIDIEKNYDFRTSFEDGAVGCNGVDLVDKRKYYKENGSLPFDLVKNLKVYL